MDRGAWLAKIHRGRKESDTTERLSLRHSSFWRGRGEGRSPICSKKQNYLSSYAKLVFPYRKPV